MSPVYSARGLSGPYHPLPNPRMQPTGRKGAELCAGGALR